jgi:rod shape-determining protein MreC
VYQRRRARLLLILLIVGSLVLVTIDFRSGEEAGDGPLDRMRGVITTVFRPVQDGLATLVRPLGNATSSVTDLFAVRSENQRLRDRLDQLEERHQSATDLERENAELRDLLGLRDRSGLDTVAARTVALAPSNFEWTITIDVGRNAGVERNMPVISGDGLVGRVIQVEGNAARVLLAIDPNFHAAARVADSGEIGSVVGRGADPMLFTPLDPEAEMEVGDELVTSSYDGGVYPSGIPIGTVGSVGDTATRLIREAEIRPFVDFTRLHHVLVVLNEPVEDLPPLQTPDDDDFIAPDVDPTLDPEVFENREDDEDGDDEDGDDEDGEDEDGDDGDGD